MYNSVGKRFTYGCVAVIYYENLDKHIPQQAKFKKIISPHKKHFFPGDKVLFKAYKNNITIWEVSTIKQRIGELVYIV